MIYSNKLIIEVTENNLVIHFWTFKEFLFALGEEMIQTIKHNLKKICVLD
jgi:hypothetical protein